MGKRTVIGAWWRIVEWPVEVWPSGKVLYLGELNDNQRAGWVRTIEAFSGEKSKSKQLALFPDDREELPAMDCETIRVQLDKIELRNPREWGSVLVGIVFVGSAGEDYSLAQKDKAVSLFGFVAYTKSHSKEY